MALSHHILCGLRTYQVSVTAFTGGIFFEYLLDIPFWYGAVGLIAVTAVFTVFGGMKGVMTLSAIQTPILIIGSFLVLFPRSCCFRRRKYLRRMDKHDELLRSVT